MVWAATFAPVNLSFNRGHRSLAVLLSILFAAWASAPQAASKTHFVNAAASGNADGSSWVNAFPFLQDALAAAEPGDEIWVALGIYRPDQGAGRTEGDRLASFELASGVALYGGFAGGETDRSQRDPGANPTILTGEIGDPQETDDNSEHIVVAKNMNDSAVFDGFTVTASHTHSGDGGGLKISKSSLAVENCSFIGNSASDGGAVFIESYSYAQTSSHFSNCSFSGNSAQHDGGAVAVSGKNSSVDFVNCTFVKNSARNGGAIHIGFLFHLQLVNCCLSGNSAEIDGGAITGSNSLLVVTNCTISGNSASRGGGIFAYFISSSSNLTLENCIVWNNMANGDTSSPSASIDCSPPSHTTYSHCLVENSGGSANWNPSMGEDLGGNIDADPLFLTPADPAQAPSAEGEFFLHSASPAIDAGDNAANTTPSDIDGRPRVINATIDLGARELDPTQFVFSKHMPSAVTLLADPDLVYEDLPDFSVFCNLAIASVSLISNSNPDVLGVDTASGQSADISPTGVRGECDLEFEISSALVTATHSLHVRTVQPVVFVDLNAPAGGDGTSWSSAFRFLQDALAASVGTTMAPPQSVWVARGTYRPDQGADRTEDDRLASFELASGVALYGGFAGGETDWSQRDPDANPTILSGEIGDPQKTDDNSCHVLIGDHTDSSSVLDGFTVTGGYANMSQPATHGRNGGAILLLSASPVISNCIFSGNHASYSGGALAASASPLRIRCCVFFGNDSWRNGGVVHLSDSSAEFLGCTLSGNSAVSGGAINAFESPSSFTNCVISGNFANYTDPVIHTDNASRFSFVNCTITGNAAKSNATTIVEISFSNCIVWNNSAGDNSTIFSGSLSYSHCLVENSGGSSDWNSALGEDLGGNIDAAPLFLTPADPDEAPSAEGEFFLHSSSPAIDAGDNAANTTPSDIDGRPRVINATIDLGARELDPAQFVFSKHMPSSVTLLADPDLVYEDLPDFSAFCNLAVTKVSLVSNSNPDVLGVDTASGQSADILPTGVRGECDLEFEISSASATATHSLHVRAVQPVVFVDSGASAGGDGTSWSSAFRFLQDALAASVGTTMAPPQAVWVARGTYRPDQGADRTEDDRLANFELASDVALYGGFAGNETDIGQRDPGVNPTILSGEIGDPQKTDDNSCHVLLGDHIDSSSVLDGFTVTAGYANIYGSDDIDTIRDCVGGALLLLASSPGITNCSFTGNTASYFGGAAYIHGGSAPLFVNCSFSENLASSGGGAVNNRSASPSFINCTFHANRATGIYSSGGAVSNDFSNSSFTNCTFSGNSAVFSDGAIHNGACTMTNCIVWRNTARENSFVSYFGNWSHCLVEGANPGGSCLDGTDPANNPLFASPSTGDFRLLTGSPALDSGDNAANPLPTDLAGNPRIQNNTIDLGAFEGSHQLSFSLLFSGLAPDGDENGDGQSNYHDYASGADPRTPDSPMDSLAISGRQLTVPSRAHASDVFIILEKSISMIPGSWVRMTEGIDYRAVSSSDNVGQTRLVLEILDSAVTNQFFRVRYSPRADE